ncbi:VWA domain-containing protein [Tepidamorphus sp. 3E244]|uniref:VWA domain-containing protein n=1 Tax=Tepidamorphus sp. 3E244 TaxID=3385498 RepID=UPI0038FCD49B
MADKHKDITSKTGAEVRETNSSADVAAFLNKARAMTPAKAPDGARGRLVFALDATMSRQPTWDVACKLQGEMFRAAGDVGGLDIQLVYFRGFNECRAGKWASDASALANMMTRIDCRGGQTQIGRVLSHVRTETGKKPVQALVYVGDAMEENVDHLCAVAGELGLLKVPVFLFQEGRDPIAEQAFREIARLTGGAFCRFDPGSAAQLKDLLSAVAVYAAGGMKALEKLSGKAGGSARLMIEQMGGR